MLDNSTQNSSASDNSKSTSEPKYVVGIGASAGGLEALQQLLEVLPSNTGVPYIIVQHLSPDYKSLLAEILTKYTDMPVVQAENEMPIKPDCVYLIPPKNNMQLQNGKLVLTEQVEGVFSHRLISFSVPLQRMRSIAQLPLSFPEPVPTVQTVSKPLKNRMV